MYIIPLLYHHRHGTDLVLFKAAAPPNPFPEITNELLNDALDMDVAELEREDEYAEWCEAVQVDRIKDLPNEKQ